MAQLSKTWWGNKFIEALEKFTDSGRLSRGRSYRSSDRIRKLTIVDSVIVAEVRGNVNPYYGVYKEPIYETEIVLAPISPAQWTAAIAYIASKASFISKLLLNEMPDNIEDAFTQLNLNLLPKSKKDFHTECSCPDYSNPCKHIAGVCYRIAADLDRDPFLLFELRGISRITLQSELAKTPLGKALSSELDRQSITPQATASFYTRPEVQPMPTETTLRAFWQGSKSLPNIVERPPQSSVSGILVKKQGDFPPFWERDQSFIAVMEEVYERVKSKNRDLL
ncbi:SWIM zinc finger domain protein (plasmid) [Leptolyngbya sp. NIES-3755]|nr:SWIM zinc finger domain protein [Leptolyngbya sp. NIES-3755]